MIDLFNVDSNALQMKNIKKLKVFCVSFTLHSSNGAHKHYCVSIRNRCKTGAAERVLPGRLQAKLKSMDIS